MTAMIPLDECLAICDEHLVVEQSGGRSCYGDRFFPAVAIPEAAVGDPLAFLDTGAYREVLARNCNAMPQPPTVLVAGDRATGIRRAESEVDVFRRDLIPDHLRGPRES